MSSFIGVVRLDRIGDTILTLPAIKAIRDYYKDYKIVGIFNDYNSQLFVYNDKIIHPYFDFIEIIPIKLYYRNYKNFVPNFAIDLFNYLKVFFSRVNYDFEKVFVFSPTGVSYFLGSLLRAKKRYTYFYSTRFNRFIFSKRYSHFLDPVDKSSLREEDYDKIKHEIFQNLEVVKLDIDNLNIQKYTCLELFLPEISVESYDVLVFDKELFFSNEEGLQWLVKFVKNLFYKLDGLSIEPLRYSFISNREGLKAYFSNFINPSFSQLMALVSKCRCVVCFDGGIVHLASAFGVNLVSIFTNRFFDFDVKRWGPLNKNSVIVKLDIFNDQFLDFSLTDPIDFSEQIFFYVQKFLI